MSCAAIKNTSLATLAVMQFSCRNPEPPQTYPQTIGRYPMAGDSIKDYSDDYSMLLTVDGRMSAGTGSEYDLTDNFSVSFWFRPNSSASNLIIRRDEVSGNYPWRVAINSGTQIQTDFYIPSPVLQHQISTSGGVSIGTWVHVCITYDSSRALPGRMYVDGTEYTGLLFGTPVALPSTSGERIRVGPVTPDVPDFNIDEISVWTDVLTAAEAVELYNSGSPGDLNRHSASANKLSWWRMGDRRNDSTSSITDASGVSPLDRTGSEQAIVSDTP